MKVRDLYGKHKGQDLYVIGTGPSVRVFPLDTLQGKLTIGLNQAWKYGSWTYALTVHGELLLEYENAGPRVRSTKWIVSGRKRPLMVGMNDPKYYVFWSKQQLEHLRQPLYPECLVVLHGIQNTALHLGGLMGCRRIFLVGVDMGTLDEEHHGHEQHVKYHGRHPEDVFRDMRATTREIRSWLREKGVHVFNLTSLLSVRPEEDYRAIKEELGLEKLPEPEDTSQYEWCRGYKGEKL